MSTLLAWKLAVLVAAIIAPIYSSAETSVFRSDGNGLLANCNAALRAVDEQTGFAGEDSIRFGYCLGLLEGVRSTIMILESVEGNQRSVCFPKGGINNGQTARIVVKYLKEHPVDLNQNQTLLAMLALRDAYPCR